MDGHQSGSAGRRRPRNPRSEVERSEPLELMRARPRSARVTERTARSTVAASARPRSPEAPANGSATPAPSSTAAAVPRRTARIVSLSGPTPEEKLRTQLLDRLLRSAGRAAISRSTEEFLGAGFDLPHDQAVHLQLLEHVDESRAREAMARLSDLLMQQPPIQRPVLEQRLRRLEEQADEALTRHAARELRRTLRC